MPQFWAGFTDGKINVREIDTGFGGGGSADGLKMAPALFITRRGARQEYEDVRKVEVRVISKKKK